MGMSIEGMIRKVKLRGMLIGLRSFVISKMFVEIRIHGGAIREIGFSKIIGLRVNPSFKYKSTRKTLRI